MRTGAVALTSVANLRISLIEYVIFYLFYVYFALLQIQTQTQEATKQLEIQRRDYKGTEDNILNAGDCSEDNCPTCYLPLN